MAATPTTAYPIAGFFVLGVPHVETEFPSITEAEAFVAEHPDAWTLDPKHPGREHPPEIVIKDNTFETGTSSNFGIDVEA